MVTDALKVILCANGSGHRYWQVKNKLLLAVRGEPVIHRAIRLIDRIIKPGHGIHVVTRNPAVVVPPAELVTPSVTCNPLPGYCFGESAIAITPDSSAKSVHLILMGDIWWSEYGLSQLLDLSDTDIELFGHSRHSGNKNPEIFGASIPIGKTDQWFGAVHAAQKARACSSCGWMVYQHLHGLTLGQHKMAGGFMEISSDATDIDGPEDYAAAVRTANRIAKIESMSRIDEKAPV